MTTYESNIKTISSSEEVVFNLFNDLTQFQNFSAVNLENIQGADKLKDIQFEKDTITFQVSGFGKVGLKVIDREPNKTIKFEGINMPVSANVWIQFKEVAANDTKMKLTMKAEIPPMIKMMVGGKLQEGVNMMAEVIAKLVNTRKIG